MASRSNAALAVVGDIAAQPWLPTLREIDEHRAKRIATANPMPTVIQGIRKPINKTTARAI